MEIQPIIQQAVIPVIRFFAENPKLITPLLGGISTAVIGLVPFVNVAINLRRNSELQQARNKATANTNQTYSLASKQAPITNELKGKTRDANEVINNAAKNAEDKPKPMKKK